MRWPPMDTGKKTRNGANLKLRHTLRAGGVKSARVRGSTEHDNGQSKYIVNLCCV